MRNVLVRFEKPHSQKERFVLTLCRLHKGLQTDQRFGVLTLCLDVSGSHRSRVASHVLCCCAYADLGRAWCDCRYTTLLIQKQDQSDYPMKTKHRD
jgi:hypothetical protein